MARKIALVLAFLVYPLLAEAVVFHPYAGLDVGLAQGDVALYDAIGVRHHFSNNGSDGGMAAGIGLLAKEHFWLAGELRGDFSSERTATQTISTGTGTSGAKLRMRYTYGASLVPGIWIARVMLFGRIGVLQSSFTLKEYTPPPGSDGTTDVTLARGEVYGAGIQFRAIQNFHIRTEYDRVIYNRFSSFTNRVSLTDNQIRLGLLLDLS